MLYALAYNHSPFESTQGEQGGSIAMAVLNAQYKHPPSAYSQGLKDLIDAETEGQRRIALSAARVREYACFGREDCLTLPLGQ